MASPDIPNGLKKDGGAIEVYSNNKENSTDTLLELKDCTFTNCEAYRNGGAVRSTTYATTIDGCLFAGCKVDNASKGQYGGAVALMNTANNAAATLKDSTFVNCENTKGQGKGGAAFVGGKTTLSMTDTAHPNTLAGNEAKLGGAIYVANGATVELTDGSCITDNTVPATGHGAGIHLEEGSTLKLSGSPAFTGSYTDKDGESKTGTGNFKGSGTGAKREDIYIAGYLGKIGGDGMDKDDPKLAESLIVTGALDVAKGSIWVGAQKQDNEDHNHWDTLKQFAKLADSLVTKDSSGKVTAVSGLTDAQLTKVFEAFQNAELPEYYGTAGDDLQCIYWDGVKGSRKVILRKVDASYTSLEGAKFTVYKGTGSSPMVIKHEGASDETLSDLTSGASGCFWIGILPYGTYYIKETTAPTKVNGESTTAYDSNKDKWFCLIVDGMGTYMSGGYKENTETESKAKALEDAEKLLPTS